MTHGFYLNIILASKTTLGVSLSALSVGLLGGMLLALAESSSTWLKPIVTAWTILIRGLPEIFVLFLCYYGITLLFTTLTHHFVNINAFESGVIALSLIFSAYASQIFIAAYQSIPIEEIQAGKALGLSSKMILAAVILPQIFRHALPGLLNLWLVLLKDSSIVSLIGLHDIMNSAHIAAAESFEPFNYYLFAGFVYLGFTVFSTWIGKKLEHIFAVGTNHA